jgi:type II secretory pathway pseudopilin PulG
MVIAALVVSIVAALAAVFAVWYARDADKSAARSAAAAETAAALEVERRHDELTPVFRFACRPVNPGVDTLRLTVSLVGPPELKRLDALTVTIRDDHPWRAQGTPLAGGPTPEEIAAQIWGPYTFTPGISSGSGAGADPTGRTTPTNGMPVGEELPFQLEPTRPPAWSKQSWQDWQRERGTLLRLALECHRDGYEPWTLTYEIKTETDSGMTGTTES